LGLLISVKGRRLTYPSGTPGISLLDQAVAQAPVQALVLVDVDILQYLYYGTKHVMINH
jgi:hypothetical protein